jgi:hypothetical protein
MTETRTLTGQDIGQAHKATQAVLNRLLARTGVEFEAWVTINLIGSNESPLRRDELVARVVHGLKIDEWTARGFLTDVVDHGLVSLMPVGAADPEITLTPAGITLFHEVRDGIAQITRRLYSDIPSDDLAAAHRVLAVVTGRANAELAR